MTKKDYVALAELLLRFREAVIELDDRGPRSVDNCVLRDLIVPLAHWLKRDNAAFDYARFLAACGVNAEHVG